MARKSPSKKSSSPKKKKPKTKVKKKKGLFARCFSFCFRWGIVAFIWGTIFLAGISVYYWMTMPDLNSVHTIEAQAGIDLYDREGWRIARFGQSRGETVAIDDMPKHVKNAVIAIEDRRFYSHFGLDIIGIARAMLVNVKSGRTVQGGSTLTQQLAKNLYLSPDRTLNRKIREVYLALWLEHNLTKDEILTAYLNRVYFGGGAYGISASSHQFYNKPATELSVVEAAQLAASLKAPSRLNPFSDSKALKARTNLVLEAMKDQGMITDINSYDGIPAPKPRIGVVDADVPHYFAEWTLEDLNTYIYVGGERLKVTTSYDPGIQSAIDRNVDRFFRYEAEDLNVGQAAVIVMDFRGQVHGMSGGKSYQSTQFNRATQALRQPGSVFKPIVALSAFDAGMSQDEKVKDAPFDKDSDYAPKNFNEKYYGDTTLDQAVIRSMNTATVRLAKKAGLKGLQAKAEEVGITTSVEAVPSAALGTYEAYLIDLTAAYAVMANGGRAVYPSSILRVKQDDEIIIEREIDYGPRVLSARHSRYIRDILSGVMREGTGKNAYDASFKDFGGKTGTSQGYRDAWFVGYADGYVMGVWMGNDDNTSMNKVTGGGAPAKLWRSIMVDINKVSPASSIDQRAHGGLFSRLLSGLTAEDSEPTGYNR